MTLYLISYISFDISLDGIFRFPLHCHISNYKDNKYLFDVELYHTELYLMEHSWGNYY